MAAASSTPGSANRLGVSSASPAGHRLETLKGDRRGQWSIRINDQFRVCFRWKDGHAEDVETVGYH